MRGVALGVLIGLLAGCTSSPPQGGTLRITVTGLPSGVDGRIHVTGPRLDAQVARDQELRGLDPGRYVLDIEPVRVPGSATRYPLAARVEVVVPGTAAADYGVLVPDTTKVLDAALVLDAGQSTVLLAPGTADLAPGQVLVTGAGPNTPRGLLRKVTAVQPVAGGVRVDTELATLVDAVPVGSISLRQQTFSSPTVHNGRGRTANGDLAATFPFTEHECAGVTGGTQLTWTPSVDLDWQWSKLPGGSTRVGTAKFTVESTRYLGGTFSAHADTSCVSELRYPPASVGTTELMLGPVPLVLAATVAFTSHSQVSAKSGAQYSFDSTEKSTVGVEYKNGKLDPFQHAERPDCDPPTQLDLSTRVGVRFELKPDALAGLSLDLTFGLRGRSAAVCTDFHADTRWDFAALSR